MDYEAASGLLTEAGIDHFLGGGGSHRFKYAGIGSDVDIHLYMADVFPEERLGKIFPRVTRVHCHDYNECTSLYRVDDDDIHLIIHWERTRFENTRLNHEAAERLIEDNPKVVQVLKHHRSRGISGKTIYTILLGSGSVLIENARAIGEGRSKMKKILALSDLHLERFPNRVLDSFLKTIGKVEADIFVIAGDLDTEPGWEDSAKRICSFFPNVIFVPGNHEYYESSFGRMREVFARAQSKIDNLHVLDRSEVDIDGQRFIGATLWFRDDERNQTFQHLLGDFRYIGGFRDLVYEENKKDEEFLRSAVGPGDVVITHHLPTTRSVHPFKLGSELNRFFVCDMSDLAISANPGVWIHGHTHHSLDYTIYGVRFYCNPFGYYGLELNEFFELKTLDETCDGSEA